MYKKPFQHTTSFVSRWHTILVLSWQLQSSLCQVINLGSLFPQVSSRLAQSPLAVVCGLEFFFLFSQQCGYESMQVYEYGTQHNGLASHLLLTHCRVVCCTSNSCALQGEWKETPDRNLKASELLSLTTTDKTSNTPGFLCKLDHRWSDSHNNFCVCLETKVIRNKKKRLWETERKAVSLGREMVGDLLHFIIWLVVT